MLPVPNPMPIPAPGIPGMPAPFRAPPVATLVQQQRLTEGNNKSNKTLF